MLIIVSDMCGFNCKQANRHNHNNNYEKDNDYDIDNICKFNVNLWWKINSTYGKKQACVFEGSLGSNNKVDQLMVTGMVAPIRGVFKTRNDEISKWQND